MKNSEIERWALRVIQHVVEGKPNEDSRVELKREWPQDHAKTARQIAGHANAARRENILWLIGVDEEAGAVGAQHEELAEWLPKIQSQFDGLAPRCFDLNVPFNDQVIVALLFQTDRAPFVVRNPLFGKEKGVVIQYEVPWREGASTRSANRADLLFLLTEEGLLQSLLGELEWNLAVAQAKDFRQSQFRTKKFFQALDKGILHNFSEALNTHLKEAYVAISNAQGLKKTLEGCAPHERVDIQNKVLTASNMAQQKIERVSTEIREALQHL